MMRFIMERFTEFSPQIEFFPILKKRTAFQVVRKGQLSPSMLY